jgi:hypothetical protein
VISRAPSCIAAAAVLFAGCGETRAWVLWEPESQAPDASCLDCTYRFALDGLATTTPRGGTTGAGYVDVCPADGVLVGYGGTLQDLPVTVNGVDSAIRIIGSLRATCAAVALAGPGGLVITPTGDPLPARGNETDPAVWSQTCPPGEVIVGVDSQAGLFVDQVSFVCGRLDVVSSPSGPALTVSADSALAPNGGDGGNVFQDRCPQGLVARGHDLRSGGWIDAFALVCGTPTFAIAGRDGGG